MATIPPITSGAFAPELILETGTTPDGAVCSHAYYFALTEAAFEAKDMTPQAPKDKARIATITKDQLIMFPINVRRGGEDYLQPKYKRVTSLIVPRPDTLNGDFPMLDPWGMRDMLERLPAGFAKQFEYGLGLKWEYRFIIDAISELPDITEIELDLEADACSIAGSRFILSQDHYHRLRRGLDGITNR